MKIAGALLVLLGASSAGAQVVLEMTPEKIRAALTDTIKEPCYPLARGGGLGLSPLVYLGCYTTPYSRVVLAAQNGKKKYKPITEADVVPDLLVPEVQVMASSQSRFSGPGRNDVMAIVVMPAGGKDPSKAIQLGRSRCASPSTPVRSWRPTSIAGCSAGALRG